MTVARPAPEAQALLSEFAESLSRCKHYSLSRRVSDRVIRCCTDLDVIARILFRYPGSADEDTHDFVYEHVLRSDHEFKKRMLDGGPSSCSGRDDVILFLARNQDMSDDRCIELLLSLGENWRAFSSPNVRSEFLNEIALRRREPSSALLARLYIADRKLTRASDWISRWLPRLTPAIAIEMLQNISASETGTMMFRERSSYERDLALDPRTMLTAASGSVALIHALSKVIPIADIISACYYTGRPGFAALLHLVAVDRTCLRAHERWHERLAVIFGAHFREHDLEELGPLFMLVLRETPFCGSEIRWRPDFASVVAACVSHFGFRSTFRYVVEHESDLFKEVPCLIGIMNKRAEAGDLLTDILAAEIPDARRRAATISLVEQHYGNLHWHSCSGIAELIADFVEGHGRLPVGNEIDLVVGGDSRYQDAGFWRTDGLRLVCPQACLRMKRKESETRLDEYVNYLSGCITRGTTLELGAEDHRILARCSANNLMPLMKALVEEYDRVRTDHVLVDVLAVVQSICGDKFQEYCEDTILELNSAVSFCECPAYLIHEEHRSALQQRARLRSLIHYCTDHRSSESTAFFWRHVAELGPLAAEHFVDGLCLHGQARWRDQLLSSSPRHDNERMNLLATWLHFAESANAGECDQDVLARLCTPSGWGRNDVVALLHERIVALGRYRSLELLYRVCTGGQMNELLNALRHTREIAPVASWLARNRAIVSALAQKDGIDASMVDAIVIDGERALVGQLVNDPVQSGEITDTWLLAHGIDMSNDGVRMSLLEAAASSGRVRWVLYLCSNYNRWTSTERDLIERRLVAVQSTYNGNRPEAAETGAAAYASDEYCRKTQSGEPMELLEQLLWNVALLRHGRNNFWDLLNFFVTARDPRIRCLLARHTSEAWRDGENARELMIADIDRSVCAASAKALTHIEDKYNMNVSVHAVECARAIAGGLRDGRLDARLALDLIDSLCERFNLNGPIVELEDYVESLLEDAI